jgi:hypothetical protein
MFDVHGWKYLIFGFTWRMISRFRATAAPVMSAVILVGLVVYLVGLDLLDDAV